MLMYKDCITISMPTVKVRGFDAASPLFKVRRFAVVQSLHNSASNCKVSNSAASNSETSNNIVSNSKASNLKNQNPQYATGNNKKVHLHTATSWKKHSDRM